MGRTRILVDVVHEEDEITDRQKSTLAKATSDFVHAIGVADLEITVDPDEEHAWGHNHVSTPESNCAFCRMAARDELN